MVWPAIIAAAGALAGGILGNKASAKEAQKNRDFQEEMSNTSYQRAVADMKAAGLSPMLAYSQGGASQPSGGQAPQNDVITPAIHSGMAAYNAELATKQNEENVKNTAADTAVKAAQEAKLRAETPAGDQWRDKLQAEKNKLSIEYNVSAARQEQILAEIANIRSENAKIVAATKLLLEQGNLTRQQAGKAAKEIVLLEARIPGAQAVQALDETWYGQKVRPLLDDMGNVLNSAGKARLLMRGD